jgi:biotin transport system substrate-specific component
MGSTINASAGTLLTSVAPSRDGAWVLKAAAVLFVTVLTVAAAQVSVPIPFTPVPLTLQPMVVLLGAAALGARLGMASPALYLLAGVAGLPVFAASPLLPQGAARLFGPTGGYLLAYPAAAFVTGWLAERGFGRRYVTSVLAMAAGLSVIFAGGVAWLAFFPPAAIGLRAALAAGLYPFVGPDILKLLVAAGALPGLWRIIGRTSSAPPA